MNSFALCTHYAVEMPIGINVLIPTEILHNQPADPHIPS